MSFRRNKGLLEHAGEIADHLLESTVEHAKEAQAKAAPLVSQGIGRASEKGHEIAERAAAARTELADRAGSVSISDSVATLKSSAADLKDTAAIKAGLKEEPKSGGRLKKLVLLGALLAVGGFVFKKLRGNPDTDSWQQAYVPKPAPAPAAPDTTSDPITDPVAEGAPADDGTDVRPDPLTDPIDGAESKS